MTAFFQIIAACIVTLLLGCANRTSDSNSGREKDPIITISKTPGIADTPGSFVMNYGPKDNQELFVFVGQKVSIVPFPNSQHSMDNGYIAKYAILNKVYGDFPEDTIEFVTYDHYGIPPFSMFKNVLLFLSADSGLYFHQKYMFNDVYKTKNGRWAGAYSVEDYKDAYNKHTTIKPIRIDFVTKVAYPTKIIGPGGEDILLSYPKPYFKTVGDSAIAIYGNYVEELFALKKTGVLTAREMFDPTAQQEEDMVVAWQPEKRKTPPSADDLKFLAFWKSFATILKESDLKSFREGALDTVYVCDKVLPVQGFIDKCLYEVIDDEVRKRIGDESKLEYGSSEIELYNLVTAESKRKIIKVGGVHRIRTMFVTRSTKNNNPPSIYFGFIETKYGYRLYEISHAWAKECCQ